MSKIVFIRSKKRPGFRRAGRYFPFEGINMLVSDLTQKQLTLLRAESQLIISEGSHSDRLPEDKNTQDIVEAIGMMEIHRKPHVKDLENLIGKNLTAVQRDTA